MSTRTLIEINHDYLPEAMEEVIQIVQKLGYAGLRELKERHDTRGVVVLSQRHHSEGYLLSRRDFANIRGFEVYEPPAQGGEK